MPCFHSWLKDCLRKMNMVLGNDIGMYRSYLFTSSEEKKYCRTLGCALDTVCLADSHGGGVWWLSAFHKYPNIDLKHTPAVILSHCKFSEGRNKSPLSIHALYRSESLGTHFSSTKQTSKTLCGFLNFR